MAEPDVRTIDLEDCVVRFRDLAQHESPFHPFDMRLDRFDRRRYSVVGRPAEQKSATKSTHQVKEFSVVYISCEPGKGIGAHGHATAEVFIVLSGRWKVTLGAEAEREIELEPFDVISVPPDAMHGAVNVSDETAWLMAINAGHAGAPIRWAPKLVEEIRAMGKPVSESETPGRR
jgi:quercetin dioxygenase-like cupin family protein